jgi:acetyl-CoA synthetase
MSYVKKSKKGYMPTEEGRKVSLVPQDVYEKAKDRVKFWEDLSKQGIDWIKPWTTSYKKEKGVHFSWFKDGKLNLCANAVDRHLSIPNRTAIAFVPENPREKTQRINYFELFKMVNNAAAILKKNGVGKGDTVAIYMPMIPEALIYMLACARVGAIHSVVFSAFSSDALRTRIIDGRAKLMISADYYAHAGKKVNLKKKALAACKGIKIRKLILKRKNAGKILASKNVNYVAPEPMSGEDLAFILYTSGTTGKPKGVMHAVGGYTVQAYWSCRYIFGLQPGEVMWCTADIGWITGHTYATYGPLLNGATTVIFEGVPTYPNVSRFLRVIEDNKVSAFYTAPTALRMFAMKGADFTKKYKLKSLKVLGSVGEPIDEKTWMWYYNNIGKGRCPVVDTYWQTETGSAVIASLPGIGPFIPSFAGKVFPGMEYEVVDNNIKKVKSGKKGMLVQVPPFAPGLMRGVWRNDKRYKKYFKKGNYLAEDNAYVSGGNIRVLGRSDDVIKVAGHRMSTAEIEDAIASLPGVAEAAIVAKPDKLRGEVPVAFVKTKKEISEKEVVGVVMKKIGPIAKPKEVYFVKDIPKTRSGKMMRRILKALAAGEEFKNLSTLVNPEVVEEIKKVIAGKK